MSELVSPTKRFYHWPAIIKELRKQPGQWRRILPNVPVAVTKSVRLRRHPALRMTDGHVEADVSFVYRDNNGHLRGDVLLRFVPK